MTHKLATPKLATPTTLKLVVKLRSLIVRSSVHFRKQFDLIIEVSNRIVYKTPIRMSLYRLLFGKPYHLLAEIEHRAF